jgi:ubiquinone/menaquinone biosynthesis C-methylase UbiE
VLKHILVLSFLLIFPIADSLSSSFTEAEVEYLWDSNAVLWDKLTSEGREPVRDYVSLRGHFEILPDVSGLRGIDIGCGEGHTTRLLAQHHASMEGIDISANFIDLAYSKEAAFPLGITYTKASATKLPHQDSSFDFASSVNVLMDLPDYKGALQEIHRVLKPGGFFQFTILHPVTWPLHTEWLYDEAGHHRALAGAGYFSSENATLVEWIFEGVDRDVGLFHTVLFRHTLSDWINSLIEVGFVIDRIHEPKPSAKDIAAHPELAPTALVPWFLIVRVHKPIDA